MRKRTDRLVQDEIVSFVTFVDPLKVGVAIYAIIGIEVDLNKSRDVQEQLAQLHEVTSVGYANGTYDLIIAAILRSNDDFFAFLLEKVARIKGIRSTDTSLVLKLVEHSFVWSVPDSAMVEFLMPPATSS